MKLLEIFRVRAVLLVGAGLLLSSIGAQGQSISTQSWKEYRVWAKSVYPERDVALAVAPNGSWAAESGFTKSQAKQKALNNCKTSHYNPDNVTCRIVDVNLKRVGTSVATTTSNSSTQGYCAKASGFFNSTVFKCNTESGTWVLTYDAAKNEHLRLKNQSSTVATTTSKSSAIGWCATGVSVFEEHKVDCDIKGGKWNLIYGVAQAEHRRLKNQPSTVATTTCATS
jgi:hypothetical protein